MIEYIFGIRVATPEVNASEASVAGANRKSVFGPAKQLQAEYNRVLEETIIYLPDQTEATGNPLR